MAINIVKPMTLSKVPLQSILALSEVLTVTLSRLHSAASWPVERSCTTGQTGAPPLDVRFDVWEMRRLVVKIRAVSVWAQAANRVGCDAVNPPNPPRHVALVGESSAHRDFRKAASAIAKELDRPVQPQMHDITVWGYTNRSGEDA
jgi:hypothetical protein